MDQGSRCSTDTVENQKGKLMNPLKSKKTEGDDVRT